MSLIPLPSYPPLQGDEPGVKIEYRVWNPFRRKLAAAILGGVDKIHIKPGAKVLYLGAASGTTVSHVADIVGPVSVSVSVTRQNCEKNFDDLIGRGCRSPLAFQL